MGDETTPAGEQQADADAGALLSRLRLIEDQPLDARAAAYLQVHEELQAKLEGGDAPRRNG